MLRVAIGRRGEQEMSYLKVIFGGIITFIALFSLSFWVKFGRDPALLLWIVTIGISIFITNKFRMFETDEHTQNSEKETGK